MRRLLVATETVLTDGFDYPPAWRNRVRRYQQAVLDAITSVDGCIPLEYHSSASTDEAFDRVQAYVGQFGGALAAWPELWSLCSEQRRS